MPVSFNVELPNIVFTRFEGKYITGEVFQGETESNEVLYYSLTDGALVEDKTQARRLFNFSYCWRGVWEGRIYFTDEEYWSSELAELSKLWDFIEHHCKMLIKSRFPGHYDD